MSSRQTSPRMSRHGRHAAFLTAVLALASAAGGAAPALDSPGLPATTAPGGSEVERVLERVRRAIGWEQMRKHERGILVRGVVKFANQEAAFAKMFTPLGQTAGRAEGILGGTSGFNGTTAWTCGFFSGELYVYEPTLDEFDRKKLSAWLDTGYWLDQRCQVTIRILEGRSNESRIVLSVKLDEGQAKQWVVIDRSTWLPRAICDVGELNTPHSEFEDYREIMGFRYPYRIVDRQDALGAVRSTSEVGKVESTDAWTLIEGLSAQAAGESRELGFDPTAPSRIELKRAAKNGHWLVRPRIDDQRLGWFVLDTGSSAIIVGPRAIEKGNLPALWRWKTGPASSPVDVGLCGPVRFQLGPVVIPELVLCEMPYDSLCSRIGPNVLGFVGYDFFRRAVVEVDIHRSELTIHDPAAYRSEAAHWENIYYHSRQPCIRCRFEGDQEALFMIDTGSPGTVSFTAPAVKRFKLLRGRKTSPFLSIAIGGESSLNRSGTLAWFEIGGQRIEDVENVDFERSENRKPYNDRAPAGSIGLGLLKEFKVIFDYPHKRIGFIKVPGQEGAGNPDQQDHDEDN